ncbi:MAG: hypothetical protein K8J08_20485, partial [Thermoanaerobaculia bacterium]|nr:hypothetical protein [Thermoanaerobaculia bacterium]
MIKQARAVRISPMERPAGRRAPNSLGLLLVALLSQASVEAHDIIPISATNLNLSTAAATYHSASDDGRFFVYSERKDPSVVEAIYLHDLETGSKTLVSHSAESLAQVANDTSRYPEVSGDGSTVTFVSHATDLVPGFVPSSSSTLH